MFHLFVIFQYSYRSLSLFLASPIHQTTTHHTSPNSDHQSHRNPATTDLLLPSIQRDCSNFDQLSAAPQFQPLGRPTPCPHFQQSAFATRKPIKTEVASIKLERTHSPTLRNEHPIQPPSNQCATTPPPHHPPHHINDYHAMSMDASLPRNYIASYDHQSSYQPSEYQQQLRYLNEMAAAQPTAATSYLSGDDMPNRMGYDIPARSYDTTIYSPYLTSTMPSATQQDHQLEHQQQMSLMRTADIGNAEYTTAPVYPRAMYQQYETPGVGFSVMNLTRKLCSADALQFSGDTTTVGSSPLSAEPIIDLSADALRLKRTADTAMGSPHHRTRIGAASSPLVASPQTLDLRVGRMAANRR